jgi:signal transduction histidine kinase
LSGWTLLAAGMIGVCIGLMAVGLRRLPDRRLFPPVLGIVVTVTLWGLGDAITGSAADMRTEQIGIAILYTGSIFQPACWWLLALRWTEHVGQPPPALLQRAWWVPIAWATAWWGVMLTNPWHRLLLTPVVGARNEYTALWWVLALTGFLVILGAGAVTVRASRRLESSRLRRHADVMAASSLMIVLSTCAYVLFGEPFSHTALACLGAAASVMVFGMLRWGLFGLLPLALPVVFERSPDGLLVVDGEGRLLHANPRAHQLLAPASLVPDVQIPAALAPGLRTAQGAPLRGDAGVSEAWWRDVARDEGVLHRHASSEGTVWLHVSSHVVVGSDARAAARAVRVRDVTREVLAQADQRRARRLESVTQLARGVAHDWNNVLASIRGNADLLTEELEDSPRLRQRVEKISRVARRAGELADQLQLYAGGAAAVREPVDLNELVVDAAEVIDPEGGPQISLELDLSEAPVRVEVDATQLRQALLNLLVNAREALSEAGGEIHVATGVGSRDPADLRGLVLGEGAPKGVYAWVRISDNGAGMDPELQERIFEPFFSTKGKQRGTGLATVIGVIRAHEGLVHVESMSARGTAFTLSLPV